MFSLLSSFSGNYRDRNSDVYRFIEGESIKFCKVFTPDNPEGRLSGLPYKFIIHSTEDPKTLEEAYELTKFLARNPNLLAIRGVKVEGVPEPLHRNKETFNTNIPSSILVLDVDSLSTNIPAQDLEGVGDFVISKLHEAMPEVFPEDLGYVIHASSSAGIKSGVRAHFLFEVDKPATQGQYKTLMQLLNSRSKSGILADTALYNRTQPHFFADPQFLGGMEDPFAKRSRVFMKKGSVVRRPLDLREYSSRSASISPADNQLFSLIEGLKEIPEDFEHDYELYIEAQGGLYVRRTPRLFHRALQTGVCLGWLAKQITPKLEKYVISKGKKRSARDYIENAKKAALQGFLDSSRREAPDTSRAVPIRDISMESPTKFLRLDQLPAKGSVTFVKASLGTGKTTAITNWIDKGMIDGRFLAITNTRSLVGSNALKFRSGMYNKQVDLLGFSTGVLPRMSTTIHSLHKFAKLAPTIKFLFIDEIDAVVNDLLFSPLIPNRGQCIQTLHDMIMFADHVVFADGDISSETIEVLGLLIDFNKPINKVVHERRMLADCRAHEFPDEGSVWAAIKGCLDIGDTALLVSDCSPDTLNEKGMALRNQTGCIVKEIHSGSTEDEDIKDILENTNDALREQKIDALLCSPSVTGGLDFSYFDSVFVITNTNNHTPNLRFQASRRDRGAKDIYYYTSRQTEGFDAGSETHKGAEEHISKSYSIELGWVGESQKIYAERRERESRNFRNTFRYYLLAQGCRVHIHAGSWGVLESEKDEYMQQKIHAILESTANYSPERHNDAFLTKEHLVRYFHIEDMADITYEDVELFLSKKPHKRAEFFHKLYKDFWPAIKQCGESISPFVKAIEGNKSRFYLATGRNANPKFAKMYLTQAGISKPGEFDEIIDFYRTYCKIEGYDIPEEFLTEDERERRDESVLELV